MAKRWITRQYEAEAARNAAMAGRIAVMTERELVAELSEIEIADRAMRMDRTANQSGWERLATRSRIVRAELSNRRQAVAEMAR
jgi:hypothetical protein